MRLSRCTGWSGPLLFAVIIIRFFFMTRPIYVNYTLYPALYLTDFTGTT